MDLDPESLTIGYVFKAQYFLPYNTSQLYPTRLSRDIKDDEYQQQQFQNNDYEIEIEHETHTAVEDDVDLDEFSDEIDGWVIDEFKKIGCDTAKSVLDLDRDELVRRTDLEEETIDDVIRILKSEFE